MMSQPTKSHFNPHFCKNLKISFTFFTFSNNKVNKTVCYHTGTCYNYGHIQ